IGQDELIKASRDKTCVSCVKLDPNIAETKLKESVDDSKLKMSEDDSEVKPSVSHRFRCPGPGQFQCTSTGLVFVMDQEAELFYKTVQWDENLLQSVGKMAAGPLFSIQCPQGGIRQLHSHIVKQRKVCSVTACCLWLTSLTME
ncbi:hypothetical protein INR49_019251, partial [Caranx melampygus]